MKIADNCGIVFDAAEFYHRGAGCATNANQLLVLVMPQMTPDPPGTFDGNMNPLKDMCAPINLLL